MAVNFPNLSRDKKMIQEVEQTPGRINPKQSMQNIIITVLKPIDQKKNLDKLRENCFIIAIGKSIPNDSKFLMRNHERIK